MENMSKNRTTLNTSMTRSFPCFHITTPFFTNPSTRNLDRLFISNATRSPVQVTVASINIKTKAPRLFHPTPHISTLDISNHDFNEFIAAVDAELSTLFYNLSASSAQEDVQTVSNIAFRLVTNYFPAVFIDTLLSFPYSDRAPPALHVVGMPVDRHASTTPSPKRGTANQPFMPVCDAVLLGIARLMGIPLASGRTFVDSTRNGVTYNLLGTPNDGSKTFEHLPLHRDYIASITKRKWEPDAFALLGVRGDDKHNALTTVVSIDELLKRTDATDLDVLKNHTVRARSTRKSTGEVIMETDDWHPIEETATGVKRLNLFSFQHGGVPDDDIDYQIVSEISQAKECYERLMKKGEEMAQGVDLQMGQLLLINNLRAVHGRTSYTPYASGDERARWFAKVLVSFEGWTRPGTMPQRHYGIVDWPNAP